MATFASFSIRLVERARTFDPAWRWALGVFLIARVFYSLWGFVILLFVPALLQNLNLFGSPEVAYFNLDTGERYAYSRHVGERVLTFHSNGDGTMTDSETSSVWSLRAGTAVSGPLAGTKFQEAQYSAEELFPYRGVSAEGGWFGVWQRFDVVWYQAIAEKGYGATNGDVHFPPLYPFLESILGKILGGRFFFAGWLLSQGALIWSMALLYRMAEAWRNSTTARRAVVFMLLFPTAFFFFTGYSESLFLLVSLLCFRALEREQWTWAGFFVFLAILTRLQGVALFAPLVYCVWQKFRAGEKIRFAQLFMLGVPLLAGLFYLALRFLSGDGNVLPTSEPQLNAHLAPPWDNLIYALQTIVSGKFLIADVLNLVVTVLVLVILARGWRLLSPGLAFYAAATILIVMLRYVDTQPLNSMTRYVVTLFPLFMVLAYWSKNRWVERAVVYPGLLLSLFLSAEFILWGWVA